MAGESEVANVLTPDVTKILENKDSPAEVTPASRRAKGMSEDEFQTFVYEEANRAKSYTEQHLIVAREKATNYYHGRLPDIDLEDADEDRSKAVVTEVRDAVLAFMPDIMRMLMSGRGIVEYQPVAVDDPGKFAQNQADAKTATQYVQNVVLRVDNPDFFMTTHNVVKDSAVRKNGWFRWYWETKKKPEYTHYTGLTEELVHLLAADDEVEVTSKSMEIHQDAVLGEFATYDVTIRRVRDTGRVRITGVPTENMIVSAGARDEDDATLIGFTDELDAGEFVSRGLVESLSDLEGCDYDPQDRDNPETLARRPGGVAILANNDPEPAADPSRRKIKYGELFLRVDKDGDGIAEMHRVITAGTRFKVLEDEPWEDERDFASLCPYPEAFELHGESIADLTMDIQRINSRILRDTLDSLAQAIKPQMTVVEGMVTLDDVLNPDTSNVIRQRAPGMIAPIATQFVGKEALPVIDMMQQMRQNRTGISDATAGLDPKTFQSTDNDAIQNTLTKGEGRVEFIARMYVETAFKRLFRGVLRLLCKHQSQPRAVELSGKPVVIDPRHWNSGMHVESTLQLGRGGQQAQIASLTGILAKQEQLLQTLGPTNPFVTVQQYYNTLAQLCEIAGWNSVGDYFTNPAHFTPEQMQQIMQAMQQAMQQAAQGGKGGGQGQTPDPQVEMEKIKSHEQIKGAELQAKTQLHGAQLQEKAQHNAMQIRLKQAEMQYDREIKLIETMVSSQTQIDVAKINALIAHAGQRLDAAVRLEIEHMQPKEKPASGRD
jgi:hypothetical protein